VANVFEQLRWDDDSTARLDDLVFVIEAPGATSRQAGEDCFRLYKTRRYFTRYERFWAERPEFAARNIVELGIWDGGSVALWYHQFRPRKFVAVDIETGGDSAYFEQWRSRERLEARVRTYWSTDQGDATRLAEIVDREFGDEPLDLVIDDASHLYDPTRQSFQVLFPRLRHRGLYVIEDWTSNYLQADHPPLAALVHDLVAETATSSQAVSEMTVYRGFVAIERTRVARTGLEPFELRAHAWPNARSSAQPSRRGVRARARALVRRALAARGRPS
jgi:methyltransferase family protein